MIKWIRAAALLFACLLLLPALPAAAEGGAAGLWKGKDAYGTMMLMLGEQGCFISVYESNTAYKGAGLYDIAGGVITFSYSSGTSSQLQCGFAGDSLMLSDEASGESMTLDRQPMEEIQTLAGGWMGTGDAENMIITFREGGEFQQLDVQEDSIEEGIFLLYGDSLIVTYTDGTALEMICALAGDTLTLKDSQGTTVVFERLHETQETAAPAAETPVPAETAPPEATAAPVLPALTGTWKESGLAARTQLILNADGTARILRGGLNAVEKQGAYTADGSAITLTYDDGTREVFRYMLMGDTMLLTDEKLQNPVTLLRETAQEAPAASLDPALAGTWGMADDDGYREATISKDGQVTVFFPAAGESKSGRVSVADGRITVALEGEVMLEGAFVLEGDTLKITGDGGVTDCWRKPGPLVRGETALEEATAAVDAALLGTWGGLQEGVYTEWTFHGNGAVEKLVPQDETLSLQGTYMANSGKMYLLTASTSLTAEYAVDGEKAALTFAQAEPAVFTRMAGPLTREENPAK